MSDEEIASHVACQEASLVNVQLRQIWRLVGFPDFLQTQSPIKRQVQLMNPAYNVRGLSLGDRLVVLTMRDECRRSCDERAGAKRT